jgi:hypothetical protein
MSVNITAGGGGFLAMAVNLQRETTSIGDQCRPVSAIPARDGYAKFHRAVQDPLSRFSTLCWKINFKLIFDKAQTISVK